MTTRQLAEQNNVQPASIARKLKRWHEKDILDTSYGLNDILPTDVIERILSDNRATTTKTKTTTRQVLTETVKEKETVKPEPLPVPIPVPPPIVETPTPIPTPIPEPAKEMPGIFNSKIGLYLAAFILISADGLSSAWIAYNSYEKFPEIAALLFGLGGIAIGYSAIRVIVTYNGWNNDNFAYGFATFQLLMHFSAMGVFGEEWSYYFGKIVISFALVIATGGTALAIKSMFNKK
jgi:hypothetical protein